MTLQEIRTTLERALPVRIPQFDPDMHPREKIAALEDHLLKCAWHRGELEEALYWAIEAGKVLRAQWDDVSGHEAMVRGSRPTKEQLDAAKAKISPQTWAGLQECRSLVDSLKRQIVRLGGTDYDAASRAYTLISGS